MAPGEVLRKFASLFRKERLEAISTRSSRHIWIWPLKNTGERAYRLKKRVARRRSNSAESSNPKKNIAMRAACPRSIVFCRICAMPLEHYGAISGSQSSPS